MSAAKAHKKVEATVQTQIEVPCSHHGHGRNTPLFVTFNNLSDKKEHIALVYSGKVWTPEEDTGTAPLVRIHSKCLTGDTFGSRLCDCGPQLQYAQQTIGEHGGVLLYMDQEGRGIGLYNKLKCYFLKATQGLDTYEANRHLNFPDDLRDYAPAAEMLTALHISRIQLMTNNPDKAQQIAEHGIEISAIANTPTFETEENHDYLACKKKKTQHNLNIK